MRRKQTEQNFQKAVAQLLDKCLDSPVEWTAIGHGGGGKVRGAILKAMGLKPGWPDIIISVPFENKMCRHSIMVGLELKAPDGVVSPAQKLMHVRLERSGWQIYVCRDMEDVVGALRLSGVPHRAITLYPNAGFRLRERLLQAAE